MARCCQLLITLAALLTCLLFYIHLQYRTNNTQGSRRTHMKLPEAECLHLKSLILNYSRNTFNNSQFLTMINSLQGCYWVANHTARDLRQSEFMKCCNASHNLMMTQEIAPVGHILRFDGDGKTYKVTERIRNLFPKTSPLANPIRSCAVVGNGGILRNSSCGADIDKADFVFRLNFSPLNWTEDHGTKTDLISANPSILINKYGRLQNDRKPFINMVKAYGSALFLMPAFSYGMNTEVSLRALYSLEDFDMGSKVVFYNPQYLKNLTAYWRGIGLRFKRMSSGLILASVALEVCQKVTLYGFWPFSQNLEGIVIPHHYYDNMPPTPGFHSMPDEFYQYLRMHSQGILQLKVGQCY